MLYYTTRTMAMKAKLLVYQHFFVGHIKFNSDVLVLLGVGVVVIVLLRVCVNVSVCHTKCHQGIQHVLAIILHLCEGKTLLHFAMA